MKMTTALVALMVFGVYLLSVPEFTSFGTQIIEDLLILTPTQWAVNLVALASAALLISIATRLVTGQTTLTAPAVLFVISILASPLAVIFSVQMPTIPKYILLGIWTFIMIGGVGGALRGDL